MHEGRIDGRTLEPPTGAFAERLQVALRTCPHRLGRRITIQQLGGILEKMSDDTEKVSASYRSLMLYLHDKRKPRDATFARAAAEALGVRWQWLHMNDGAMAPTLTVFTTLTETARPKYIGLPDDPAGPAATVASLRQVAPALAGFPAGIASFAFVWDRTVKSSTHRLSSAQRFRVAQELWAWVTAPLTLMNVDPSAAKPEFYAAAFSTLMIVLPGPEKGRDLRTTAKPKSTKGTKSTKPSARRKS